MEDLVQQVAHWKSRLTVAAYNQSDWLPPYQPPQRPPIYEKRTHDDAHELLRRYFDEPRYFCQTCHKYYLGKTSCPKQEKHDREDQEFEERQAKHKELIKYQRQNARRIGKERQEEYDERKKYEEEAERQGYSYITAYGIKIPEPDYLPCVQWLSGIERITDELWQTWTAKEKIKWVMDDW